jgi:hypothetical protein
MAKAFSVACWNVEHFQNNLDRIDLVTEFLKKQNPDVFPVYDLEWGDVNKTIVRKTPEDYFHISEGLQTLKIKVVASSQLTFKQFPSSDVDAGSWPGEKTVEAQ